MKKKLLSLVIMCFMAVSILFAGCTPKGLTDNPATDANVISNGGMAVVKGINEVLSRVSKWKVGGGNLISRWKCGIKVI